MSRLAALASPDLRDGEQLLLVPLGATEQHGPHLPLGTDTVIAIGLADALADHAPGLICAPPLAYGSSGEHQSFAGTVSIGGKALEAVLVELVRSATETFDRVLLLCAHGGNAMPLTRAVGCLRGEGRDVAAWSPAAVWAGDAHAGRIETSVMLALAPDEVRLRRSAAGNRAPLAQLMPALARGGVAAVSRNGVLGDPAGASADEGRRLLRDAGEAMADAVARWSPDGAGWL